MKGSADDGASFSVHRAPSQYRCDPSFSGSSYQPAGGDWVGVVM